MTVVWGFSSVILTDHPLHLIRWDTFVVRSTLHVRRRNVLKLKAVIFLIFNPQREIPPGQRVELSEGAGPPFGIFKEQFEEVGAREVLPLLHRLENCVHI